ncbi:hypothetical protein AEBE7430_11470 [Aeromonas bestiarum]
MAIFRHKQPPQCRFMLAWGEDHARSLLASHLPGEMF